MFVPRPQVEIDTMVEDIGIKENVVEGAGTESASGEDAEEMVK